MAGGEGPACNEILLFCILYRLNVTVHVISRQEDTLGVTLNLAELKARPQILGAPTANLQ